YWPARRHWRIIECRDRSSPSSRLRCLLSRRRGLWDEEERQAFVNFIASSPEAGDLIPDTGGVRKIRWTRAGSGKRGGTRIVYFYHDMGHPLYLLMVYAKARQEDLSPDQKRTV